METHTTEVCSICLEKILIPVEPLNFVCHKKTDLWCFSVKRVCLQCLEVYLGLDKPLFSRPSRKCLFCPENNLPICAKQECFRVDYGMMSRDSETKLCPYCSFESSHIGVARHVFSECPEYKIECECGDIFPRQESKAHIEICEKYTKCEFCEEFNRNAEMAKHMFYKHDKTKCFTCHKYIGMNVLNDHLIYDCEERTQKCEFCAEPLKKKFIEAHLKKHLEDLQKSMKNRQQTIQKEKKMSDKIHLRLLELNKLR